MVQRRTRASSGAAIALLATAAVAAGCGGGSSSPGVASVSTKATTGDPGTASSGGAAPAPGGSLSSSSAGSGGQGSGFRMMIAGRGGASTYNKILKYAECMRAHGVRNFPDPTQAGNGVSLSVSGSVGSGLDPNSPQFQSAQRACQSLLPQGGAGGPTSAQARQQALAFSQCMRSHGVPNFPDPQFNGNRVGIRISPGTGLDPSSPTFQQAQQACQGKLPGGGPTSAK
jgi:hypothetical protein